MPPLEPKLHSEMTQFGSGSWFQGARGGKGAHLSDSFSDRTSDKLFSGDCSRARLSYHLNSQKCIQPLSLLKERSSSCRCAGLERLGSVSLNSVSYRCGLIVNVPHSLMFGTLGLAPAGGAALECCGSFRMGRLARGSGWLLRWAFRFDISARVLPALCFRLHPCVTSCPVLRPPCFLGHGMYCSSRMYGAVTP